MDHNYAASIDSVEVDLNMEYADDITYVTTCGTLFMIKRCEIPAKLAPRNLTVNMTKLMNMLYLEMETSYGENASC